MVLSSLAALALLFPAEDLRLRDVRDWHLHGSGGRASSIGARIVNAAAVEEVSITTNNNCSGIGLRIHSAPLAGCDNAPRDSAFVHCDERSAAKTLSLTTTASNLEAVTFWASGSEDGPLQVGAVAEGDERSAALPCLAASVAFPPRNLAALECLAAGSAALPCLAASVAFPPCNLAALDCLAAGSAALAMLAALRCWAWHERERAKADEEVLRSARERRRAEGELTSARAAAAEERRLRGVAEARLAAYCQQVAAYHQHR